MSPTPRQDPGASAARLAAIALEILAPPAGLGVLDGPQVRPRAGGLQRVTTHRLLECICKSCGLYTAVAGAAASHARSSGHTVVCDYRTRFHFEQRIWTRDTDDGAR